MLTPQLEDRVVTNMPANRRRILGRHLVLVRTCTWALLFGLVVLWQSVSGAYSAEFAAHPDEPGHYITGLMMREYAASLFPASPVHFAAEYYLHYPKVAIGHWPPVFYIVQAVWMLLFSPSRISILLLIALITVATAATIQAIVERAFGVFAGALAAIAFVCLPVVQRQSCMVMADMLVALFCFRAANAFGRYLDSQHWLDAAGFGAYASLAILTKGNGLALALLPPIAILLDRRPAIFKRPSLWGSAAMVVILCGPWQLFTMHMVRNGWVRHPGLDDIFGAIARYGSLLAHTTGIFILAVTAIGAISMLRSRHNTFERARGMWASMMALFISVAVFVCVVPATVEDRMLISLLAPLFLFAAAGVAWLARSSASIIPAPLFVRVGIVVCGLALIFAQTTFSLPTKQHLGFDQVAESILSDLRLKEAVIMVSSASNGEGAFIGEFAMREPRPGHIILRASKVLAHSLWDGSRYECLYHTPAEVMRYMTHIPIRVLVLDTSSGLGLEHHRQLLRMIDDYAGDWVLIDSYPKGSVADAGAIKVYALAGYNDRPRGKVRIDLNPMIDLVIEK